MTRKVTMGHFAHTQALVYAADPARVKRNRSLIRPLKELFTDLLPDYNAAIFDNKQKISVIIKHSRTIASVERHRLGIF